HCRSRRRRASPWLEASGLPPTRRCDTVPSAAPADHEAIADPSNRLCQSGRMSGAASRMAPPRGRDGVSTTVVIRAALGHFPVATAALGLAGYWYLYSYQLVDRPIRADGVSHYQYLPAWIADGDPTFETQARDCCFGYTTELPIGIVRWPETGRLGHPHPTCLP